MTKKQWLNFIIIPTISIAISVLIGVLFNNTIWSIISLASGFLNAYYSSIGKWYNYIFGIIFSISYSVNCYFAGLFGFVIFTILVFTPIQIYGIINWKKHNQNNQVLMKSLNFKKATILCLIVAALSVGFGFLLSLIPAQNLSFLDSTSQMLNLAGCILIILRYRESWYIWLANNIIDLTIWILSFMNNIKDSLMMLVVSVMYLVMNIIGLVMWILIERKQKAILKK